MVEREGESPPFHRRHGNQLRGSRVASRLRVGEFRADRPVRDRDHPHARVPAGLPVTAQLLQIRVQRRDAGFLLKFSRRGGVQVLVGHYEAARKRPGSQKRFAPAPDQQYAKLFPAKREHDHVHRDGHGRKVPGIVFRKKILAHDKKILA